MTERLTLSVSEVAKQLGVSRNAAYAAVHRGEIPTVKIGKRLLIPVYALDKLLNGESKLKE